MFPIRLSPLLINLMIGFTAAAAPIGSAINYQGRLTESGGPAQGEFDMRFTLFDANVGGSPVGPTLVFDGVGANPDPITIVDGLFNVALDFGMAAYSGQSLWINVELRRHALGGYVPLSPRQGLSPAPFALFALNGAGGLWTSQGTAIANANSGNVGIGDDDPLAFLHVGPEHLALTPIDLHSEDVIIAGGDGVLGIYSDAAGGSGNGSAIALGEIGAGLNDKWGIFRDTNAAGGDLHISYGTNPDYAVNAKLMTLDAAASRVGIGTSAPIARLHAEGDVRGSQRTAFGNLATFGKGLVFDKIFDFSHKIIDVSSSAFWSGFESNIQFDPADESSMIHVGHRLYTNVPTTNALNIDFMGGCDITADYVGAGSLNDLRGAAVFTSGTGQVGSQRGLYVSSDGRNEATITDNRAIEVSTGHRGSGGPGGGVTTNYGIYVNSPSRTRPITTHFGLYFADQGAAFPNTWALYANGGKSYFRDEVGIGTSAPSYPLEIAENTPVNEAMYVRNSGTGRAATFESLGAGGQAAVTCFKNDGTALQVFSDLTGVGSLATDAPLAVGGGLDTSAGAGGFIVTGSTAGTNLSIDNNEIMCRNNGVPTTLALNAEGGNVNLIQGGTGNVGVGTASPTLAKVQISVANQRAIYGENNSATFATAFFENAGSGPAGVFDGGVTVNGSLSKSSGSFRIDHPLDPANQYLYHSFVESPDMMNIYNGIIVTDERGYATISMPEWFEVLNREFRYQLTVLDEDDSDSFVQAKVVGKIMDNRFTIRTSAPRIEVSWQLTGIRQDPWAEAHRIPVEQEKPEHERGKYQHPELYGQPREMRIGEVSANANAAVTVDLNGASE